MTTTNAKLWEDCLLALSQEMSAQEFDTWIRPLQFHEHQGKYYLLAPNRFITEKISAEFLDKIKSVLNTDIIVSIGVPASEREKESALEKSLNSPDEKFCSNLNLLFNFDYFVEGKSNQLAKAAAIQVSENFGQVYNPLFLYGSVGLGKTHLMQAVGNAMLKNNPNLKVLYLHSERFVSEMIRALQSNCITQFKNYYRSLDALLIDDIQFFAGKERSQEELFHVFNSLIESGRQMIFTCDRYPKEVHGLEERLKSRFGWGLTVAVEPPELETRVAILLNKASQSHVTLSSEVAFFIAKRVRSNVRELEGALKRVMASASFTGRIIDLSLAKEALKDLIALQERMVTIENIQKIVAEYYKIKISDLLSKRRSRSITRPRQIAMALAKELTTHSLPEIGAAFGGRDHTTVLHATRVIADLKESSSAIKEDFLNLLRILST